MSATCLQPACIHPLATFTFEGASACNFKFTTPPSPVDIDGAEYAAVRGNPTREGLFNSSETVELLTARAKRVHIGLHDFFFGNPHHKKPGPCQGASSPSANLGIVEQFTQRGWEVSHHIPSCSITDTPFGLVRFGDGVLSLVNSGFDAAQAHAACLHL